MNPILFIPIILIGLGIFAFFRFPRGLRLINQLRPKPSLTDASKWTIGPILPGTADGGGNQSKNMPLHPAPVDGGLFVLDMPTPDCQPHYVTIDHGPLTGAKGITMTGRIEGGPFFAKDGVSQASLCLYFQRQFDDWDATIQPFLKENRANELNLNTQYYRWFCTSKAIAPLVSGEFAIEATFDDLWTALRGADENGPGSEDNHNPNEGAPFFKAARDNAGQVGFVLGGGDGWGHGIMATKPSRIIITGFAIA
jgi:hypothetical protein